MSNGEEQVTLSAQHLLSCNNRGQQSCNGGYLDRAWLFLRKFGCVQAHTGVLYIIFIVDVVCLVLSTKLATHTMVRTRNAAFPRELAYSTLIVDHSRLGLNARKCTELLLLTVSVMRLILCMKFNRMDQYKVNSSKRQYI